MQDVENKEKVEQILQASGEKGSDKQKMRKQNGSDCSTAQDWKLEDLRQGNISTTQNTCPQPNHQSHRRAGGKHFLWKCPGSIPSQNKGTNQETGDLTPRNWSYILGISGAEEEEPESQPGKNCPCVEKLVPPEGPGERESHRHTKKQRQSLTPGKSKNKS